MNSHIQMPKAILKKFVNEQNFYYKFDVKKRKINRGFPKSTYTQEDYYSEHVELFFNQAVESHLNQLHNYIKDIEEKELPITIENKIIGIIKNYINLLLIRSENFHNSILNGSIFSELIPVQNPRDKIISKSLESKTINEFVDNLEISFLYNKTKVPFVLPTRGLYQFDYKNISCFNLPIDPYFGIWARMPNKIINENNDGLLVIESHEDTIVNILNHKALHQQINDGVGYVVSQNKELLENLLNSYKANS